MLFPFPPSSHHSNLTHLTGPFSFLSTALFQRLSKLFEKTKINVFFTKRRVPSRYVDFLMDQIILSNCSYMVSSWLPVFSKTFKEHKINELTSLGQCWMQKPTQSAITVLARYWVLFLQITVLKYYSKMGARNGKGKQTLVFRDGGFKFWILKTAVI